MTERPNRRQFVKYAAAPIAISSGLAGCTGVLSRGRPTENEPTSPTPPDYPTVEFVLTWFPEESVLEVVYKGAATHNGSLSPFELEEHQEVQSVKGFEQKGPKSYRWDGETEDPEITYAIETPVGESRYPGGAVIRGDSWLLTFEASFSPKDVGRRLDEIIYSLASPGRKILDGEGRMVTLFGETVSATGSAESGEQFEVVSPKGKGIDLEKAVDFHVKASDALRPWGIAEKVYSTVFPNPEPNNPEFLSSPYGTGSTSIILDWTENPRTLIHEYIHTRQDYRMEKEVRWTAEASAVYFTALISKEIGLISYEEFLRRIKTGQDARKILVEPGPSRNYTKGCRVLAALDVKIRSSSNGENTVQDVFAKMVEAKRVSTEEFYGFIEEVAGESMDEWLHKYTTTREVPRLPEAPELNLKG